MKRGQKKPSTGMSVRDVAKALGISHARVEQIERAAFIKLRKGLARLGVTS